MDIKTEGEEGQGGKECTVQVEGKSKGEEIKDKQDRRR